MTSDSSASHLAAGLSQIAQVLRSDQWALGEKHALTPTQIGVLTALGGRGPMRVSALAPQLMVTQPTISDAVSALEAKALVSRRTDPDDGRAR
ncbi:MAG: MarR family transcriptional regulator, partial [Roseovarius sp.]|nr:MarR family transcriptional regulator [Roseovarius sp.]